MNSNAKKYLLPRIILQSISLLLVFIPPMYKATFLFNTAYGMWTCSEAEYVSLWDCIYKSPFGKLDTLLTLLFIASLAASITLLVMQADHANPKLEKVAIILPFVSGAIFAVLAGRAFSFGPDLVSSEYQYEASAVFFVEVALLLASAVLSILEYRRRSSGTATAISETADQDCRNTPPITSSQLSDLEKCKALYDSGVLTKEELEAKKQQILGQ